MIVTVVWRWQQLPPFLSSQSLFVLSWFFTDQEPWAALQLQPHHRHVHQTQFSITANTLPTRHTQANFQSQLTFTAVSPHLQPIPAGCKSICCSLSWVFFTLCQLAWGRNLTLMYRLCCVAGTEGPARWAGCGVGLRPWIPWTDSPAFPEHSEWLLSAD